MRREMKYFGNQPPPMLKDGDKIDDMTPRRLFTDFVACRYPDGSANL